MESLKILFFLENQYLQTGIETVLGQNQKWFYQQRIVKYAPGIKISSI